MAGTKSGGKQTAETIKAKYGKDFYVKLGAMGGRVSREGGFYANRELARTAGAKGGSVSKRGFRFLGYEDDGSPIYVRNLDP